MNAQPVARTSNISGNLNNFCDKTAPDSTPR